MNHADEGGGGGGVVPPTTASSLDPLWKHDVVMNVGLSAFHDPGRSQARGLGWSIIMPQLHNAEGAQANRQELDLLRDRLTAAGWIIGGWGTAGQDTDPAKDAREQAEIVKGCGLAAWYVNMEAWAEGPNRGKARAYADAWVEAGAPCPLGCSCLSSDTDRYARDFDYEAFLSIEGTSIAPQCYGNVNPGYTWQAAVGMLKRAGVPIDRVTPTFGTYVDEAAKLPVPFEEYVTWPGPRGAYVGERMPVGGWNRIARTA